MIDLAALSTIGSHGAVTFSETAFSALRVEGSALFAMHWLESSADRSVPLAVDWEQFQQIEAVGAELCIAARQGGMLIGYAVYLIGASLHYRGMMVAQADAFFLRREDREGWLGVELFRVAERALRERGVHEVWQRVKKHVRPNGRTDLGPLFRYLGYREVETVWRKRID